MLKPNYSKKNIDITDRSTTYFFRDQLLLEMLVLCFIIVINNDLSHLYSTIYSCTAGRYVFIYLYLVDYFSVFFRSVLINKAQSQLLINISELL